MVQMNTKHWCDVLTGGHGVLGEMPLGPQQILQGPRCHRTWVSAPTASDIGQLQYQVGQNNYSQFLPHGKHDLKLNDMKRLMPLINIIALHPKNHTKQVHPNICMMHSCVSTVP